MEICFRFILRGETNQREEKMFNLWGREMILITVTGDTYPIRKTLLGNKYQWNSVTKSWWKMIGENSLNRECDEIRPMKSYSDEPEPKIILELKQVDINGNPLSPTVTRVHLRSMARPGDERISDIFNRELSVITVPPMLSSPGPIEPKKEKKHKLDGFF